MFLRLYVGMLIVTAFVAAVIMHFLVKELPDDNHGYLAALSVLAASVVHWLFGSNIGSEGKTDDLAQIAKSKADAANE